MNKWFKRLTNLDCNQITQDQVNQWYNLKQQGKCIHNIQYTDQGDYACSNCHRIMENIPQFVIPDQEGMFEMWPRNYARTQYFDNLFDKIYGFNLPCWPDPYIQELIETIGVEADWYDIYQIFKSFQLKDYWISWNKIINYPIQSHPKIYQKLLYVDEHWEDSERMKKKLNVFYMLYKLCELENFDVQWIPMKLRHIAITRLDLEWKEICLKFNWKFIPTNKKLKKYIWSKI